MADKFFIAGVGPNGRFITGKAHNDLYHLLPLEGGEQPECGVHARNLARVYYHSRGAAIDAAETQDGINICKRCLRKTGVVYLEVIDQDHHTVKVIERPLTTEDTMTKDVDIDIAPTKTKKAKRNSAPRPCGCGCGLMTEGGEFRMGHDAKHKSNLMTLAIFGSDPDKEKARQELEQRGWTKFLVEREAKIERDKGKAEKREAEKQEKRNLHVTPKKRTKKDIPVDPPSTEFKEGDDVSFEVQGKATTGKITRFEDRPDGITVAVIVVGDKAYKRDVFEITAA